MQTEYSGTYNDLLFLHRREGIPPARLVTHLSQNLGKMLATPLFVVMARFSPSSLIPVLAVRKCALGDSIAAKVIRKVWKSLRLACERMVYWRDRQVTAILNRVCLTPFGEWEEFSIWRQQQFLGSSTNLILSNVIQCLLEKFHSFRRACHLQYRLHISRKSFG